MKKVATAGSFFIGGFAAVLALFYFSGLNNPTVADPVSRVQPSPFHGFKAPSLPVSMSFAGEEVPLQRWEVREQLDRELLYNYYMPGNIIYMLKLSDKYFPQIEAELKANNIPDDFKYLCVAESNLQNLVSKAGASGFWQFMKGTAPGYGLEVTATVDERYHVAKSTKAACTYLKNAYQRFGNWTAAAASYNCGMGGYAQRAAHQGSNNYYDLLLPEETQRYIFRILAFKHLLSNADSLGFDRGNTALYKQPGTKKVLVTQSIPNLAAFAKSNGTSYKILKWLNPWMRERSLQVKPGKTYEIVLPAP